MLAAERLRELLDYDPETGLFRWKVVRPHRRIGDITGCLSPTNGGYLVIRVDNRLYLAHRLAWLWMTDEWPSMVDHINQIPADNRWENLRLATRRQNVTNSKIWSTNTSGTTGVGWSKQHRKWRAYFGNKHLGLFSDKSEAILAANIAREQCWQHI